MMGTINLYDTKSDFKKMRAAGKLAAQTLDYITEFVKEGVSTEHLNQLCHNFIIENGAIPAPLNYNGFPKSICTSINDVICHGIPSTKEKLRKGDIVNIDVTVILDGFYGDTSRMYTVGKINHDAQKLIDTTYFALMESIKICKPGESLAQIGRVIEDIADEAGLSVVRDFCGHGIGLNFHEEPNILHYYNSRLDSIILKPGMIFTIEPMLNIGTHKMVISSKDGWTARTQDKKLSAQFEHTIGITNSGVEIFTISPNGLDKPPYKKQ